ncbi:hypothetical protein [Rhodococcoides fascians]|uniref:hypothetical protein n=1 Tax=Rhodococcoides fascians TaxID=1828 RepID=UPI00379BA8D3
MERLPRRTPAAQMDIVGLVFDALATMVEDIPIIGDIVGFVASLFGNSSASNARIARLETIVSKGSSGYDDFNRSDTSSLGRGPQMTTDWVTGGNGQALGVQGRAAGLVEALAPADGRRWARYPTPASSSTMTADTIVDDKKVDNQACTSVIVAANAAFTEFVYANVFGTGVYLGRGTRSGNSWSFNDWKQNTSYKVGTAERVEVRASGSGIYQLVVDNTVILEHTDTLYPIDVDHRFVGFAIQCWTGILAIPEYGWRLSAFSLKSEAGTFTAIEAVETVANGAATTANGAVTVANGAQTAAENAVGTAVTQATAAATTAANAAVAVVQKEVIQKFAVFDIKSPTPGYVAINGTEWPSIPHSDLEMGLVVSELGTFHETGTQQGSGTSHTHRDNHTHPTALTAVPEKQMGSAQQWFAFIRIPVDTPLSGLNFYARGTPTDLRTRVYSVSPTGDLTALTPESPNLASLLVSTQHTSTPTNFDDAIVEAGTWVCVRFRTVGTVFIAGKEKFAPERPSGFYPRQLNATTALASGTASPESIPESSLTWPTYPSGFVPYVAVGNNIVVAQPKRYFSDDFDRADTGGFVFMGGSWSESGSIGIRTNDVSYTSTSNGTASALWSRPLTTDRQVHLIHIGATTVYATPSAKSRVMFRCAQNRASGLAVSFMEGAIQLETVTVTGTFGTTLTFTPRGAAISRSLVTGDELAIFDGIVDGSGVDHPETVVVTYKGVEIIRTDVPNSEVPFGPQRRYGGVAVQRTSFQNSPRIADWIEFDVPDVETPTP